MPPTAGLFTREDANRPTQRTARPELSAERCWEIGLQGVARMNRGARHPHMLPTGSKTPEVLILGEAPGEDEDRSGQQFVGRSGEIIRPLVEDRGVEVAWDNVCRTRPVDGKGRNRAPTFQEIECYRPSVTESIERLKPKAIIAAGGVPFNWAFGSGFRMSTARGRRFPLRVGSHVCWLYPVMHPAWVLRVRDQKGGAKSVPGEEHVKDFEDDVARAFDDLADLPPPPVEDLSRFHEGVVCTHDPGVIKKWLRDCEALGKLVGLDYEANCLRPYEANARALSVGLSAPGLGTLVFPIAHPGARWASQQDAIDAMRSLERFITKAPCPVTAHNLATELEWSVHLYGHKVLRCRRWHDTMAAAYILDERKGGHSLDFLTCLRWGFRIKKLSDVDRKALERTPLDEVLEYNGPDAKYCRRLHWEQKKDLEANGQWGTYTEFVDRVPSAVFAMAEGLPRDERVILQFSEELGTKIEKAARRFQQDPRVVEYAERYGRLEPSSPQQLAHFFKDFCGRMEGLRGTTYSTDERALSAMKDLPAARLALAHRKLSKLRGTYVDALRKDTKNSEVFPDGRLHCRIHYVNNEEGGTDTTRTAISDPSLQNFPIRENPWIRKMSAPGPGRVVVAVDMAQLEYRGYAIYTKDKVLVDSCWTGWDVHMHWAKRIREEHPPAFEKYLEAADGDDKAAMKAFRGRMKSLWVFSALYKSGWRSRALNIGLPDDVARSLDREMWEMLGGVKTWHEEQIEFYRQHRYVEYLDGTRRHSPLNANQIVNAPVQGYCSGIVCNAWNRLNKFALKNKYPWLSPTLNIHDDLSFFWMPERELKHALPVIVREMVLCPFKPVQIVPLAVEVKVGPSWGDLTEIGRYCSHKDVPGYAHYEEVRT